MAPYLHQSMARDAGCSERTVTHIRRNLRLFGSASPPLIRAGRPRSITPSMLDVLSH
ncbi:hypothetical protein ACJ73_10222 [Blastomyces percursus]|uniref:Transposase Tc1-like domain-containing protein n=1 Tax=Blastomyces percursus TaxID=1658174 RepID=A0A1J9NY64_9EURO|nr:hypothetical protein ACJ73_10222 [Blastomyces percursus]